MPSYTSYFIDILLSNIVYTRMHTYIYTFYSKHIGSNKECPIGKERDSVGIFSRYTVCYPPIVFYFPES